MKKLKLHINYLPIYLKKVNELTHELEHLQTIAEITTVKKDVENLTKALDELKAVLENIPTVKE